jgi:hypothetical protein
MDARAMFLLFHRYAHGDIPSSASMLFRSSSAEDWRVLPPGHNSIAWLVWHIARGEDWGVNAMLRGGPEVLTRDGWNERMGLSRLDFGIGMTMDEVRDLTAAIDIDALKGYHSAVVDETRSFLQDFDFDTLDRPFDAAARLAQIPETVGPSDIARFIVERWTTKSPFLHILAMADVQLHIAEAAHVLRIILPDRRFP